MTSRNITYLWRQWRAALELTFEDETTQRRCHRSKRRPRADFRRKTRDWKKKNKSLGVLCAIGCVASAVMTPFIHTFLIHIASYNNNNKNSNKTTTKTTTTRTVIPWPHQCGFRPDPKIRAQIVIHHSPFITKYTQKDYGIHRQSRNSVYLRTKERSLPPDRRTCPSADAEVKYNPYKLWISRCSTPPGNETRR